jgi:hypothetical protein
MSPGMRTPEENQQVTVLRIDRARVLHGIGFVAMAALQGTVGMSAALAAPPSAAEIQAHEAWGAAIAEMPAPEEGCFRASYPATTWTEVACVNAPKRPYLPHRNGARSQTVGDGNDFAAVTSGITLSAVGAFPKVTGVTSETGYGGQPNTYSLQLNSGFMKNAACDNAANPSNCLSWEQFVYSSSSQAAFMQYWLIGYGPKCPSDKWFSYGGKDCYTNSRAVTVPQFPITSLQTLEEHTKAVLNGNDTFVLTAGTEAYRTSGKDSVVYLATTWTQSEFNVVGDGGGSQAKFNKGSSVTVGITLDDGSTTAPVCQPNDGTTGETNNLNLGKCSVAGGKSPSIKFIESN